MNILIRLEISDTAGSSHKWQYSSRLKQQVALPLAAGETATLNHKNCSSASWVFISRTLDCFKKRKTVIFCLHVCYYTRLSFTFSGCSLIISSFTYMKNVWANLVNDWVNEWPIDRKKQKCLTCFLILDTLPLIFHDNKTCSVKRQFLDWQKQN